MSFDVFLHTCNLGTRKMRAKNPFTGESMTTFDDPGLSDEQWTAVSQLLKDFKAEGPDDYGCYTLSFGDGGEADLHAEGLAGDGKIDGCSLETRSLTPEVVNFLFRLSRIGNMVIIAATEGVGTLVTSEEQLQRVAARFPDAKVVRTATALAKELRHGFRTWKKYRDQVVEEE